MLPNQYNIVKLKNKIKFKKINKRGNKKIPGDKQKQKHNNAKSMGCTNSNSNSKGEIYRNTGLPLETKFLNNPKL